METQETFSAAQLAERITEGCYQVALRSRRPQTKRAYVYASQYDPCTRKLVLDMTDGDKQPVWQPDQLANFARGEDREASNLIFLSRAGQVSMPPFKVIGQQERFELKDRRGRVVIVGKTDATLDFWTRGQKCKAEVKSWHPNLTAGLKSFDDLFLKDWTSRAAYQMLAYLYGAGDSIGFMIMDRHGLPLILPVELEKHLDKMETFLQASTDAQDHREAGTLPDFHQDSSHCRRCWCFGGICNPPTDSQAAHVLPDPVLEARLERRHELQEAADEWEILDTEIKTRLRGVESGVCGNFMVKGTWQKLVTYPLPAEIKSQYKKEDPKGKFVLKITRF